MRNRLIHALGAEDRALLAPHVSPIELPVKTILQPANTPIRHVFFIETGLASMLTVSDDERIEVGVYGREGVIGLPVVLGVEVSPHEIIMQLGGSALRVEAAALADCVETSPTLRRALLRFVHVSIVQISQTALANGRNTVDQRLARWLLMVHDRIEGDEIALTHDFLAIMLGVRRPGVTVALHMLEGEHAIRSRRNSITVVDRKRLKAIAGPSYGGTEAIYDELFGPTLAAV